MSATVIEPDLDDRKHIDFDLNLKILHYLGILPPPDEHGIGNSAVYRWYTNLGMLLLASCVFSQLVDVFVCWGDFDGLTVNVSSMLSFAVCLYKFVKTVQMRQDIHDLLERLDRIFIVYIDHDSESDHILEESVWHSRAVTVGFLGLGGLAVVFWCFLRPLQYVSSVLIHTIGVLDHSQGCHNKNLPLIAWLPFNTTVSPYYQLTYAYHTTASLFSYLVSASLDVFYVSIIIHVCGELKLLQFSILNVSKRARRAALEYLSAVSTLPPTPPRSADGGGKKTIKLIDGEETLHRRGVVWEFEVCKDMERREEALLNIEMYRALIRCIEHHQELLNFTYDLEEKMNYIMIVQFMGSMIIICMAVYQVTVSTKEAGNFIKYMVNLASMLVQILLYCWYGQDLINQSNCEENKIRYRMGGPVTLPYKEPNHVTSYVIYLPRSALTWPNYRFFCARHLIIEASLSFFAVLRQINK
ncbi:Odorant receptor 13a [Gryllus bimaculatus]|nr:Odorant receptor 13a [Gryllus bimaculatus]